MPCSGGSVALALRCGLPRPLALFRNFSCLGYHDPCTPCMSGTTASTLHTSTAAGAARPHPPTPRRAGPPGACSPFFSPIYLLLARARTGTARKACDGGTDMQRAGPAGGDDGRARHLTSLPGGRKQQNLYKVYRRWEGGTKWHRSARAGPRGRDTTAARIDETQEGWGWGGLATLLSHPNLHSPRTRTGRGGSIKVMIKVPPG